MNKYNSIVKRGVAAHFPITVNTADYPFHGD